MYDSMHNNFEPVLRYLNLNSMMYEFTSLNIWSYISVTSHLNKLVIRCKIWTFFLSTHSLHVRKYQWKSLFTISSSCQTPVLYIFRMDGPMQLTIVAQYSGLPLFFSKHLYPHEWCGLIKVRYVFYQHYMCNWTWLHVYGYNEIRSTLPEKKNVLVRISV